MERIGPEAQDLTRKNSKKNFYKYFLSPNEMKLAPDLNSSYLHCIRPKNQEKLMKKHFFEFFSVFHSRSPNWGERSRTQDFAPESIL